LEKIPNILNKQISCIDSGTGWVFKVVPSKKDFINKQSVEDHLQVSNEDNEYLKGVGTVCLWEGNWKDDKVTEIGWGILPRFLYLLLL
jgi:hypothetical protein